MEYVLDDVNKLWGAGEHLSTVLSEASAVSESGGEIAAALYKCRVYREERNVQESISATVQAIPEVKWRGA